MTNSANRRPSMDLQVARRENARRRAVLLYGVALLGILVLPSPWAAAQPTATVEALSVELTEAQRAHLWRVGAWGAANAAAGSALIFLSDAEARPGRRAFGIQAAAWGAINVGIAVAGLAGSAGAPDSLWADALGAENTYADILLVNLGLNVGYMAVGGTLLAVAGRGVSTPDAWRGHGSALVVQGLGLLVLDGLAYIGTRARLGALVDLAGSTALVALPDGVGLVVGL